MKFSVLIPLYKNDRADQVKECLESIRCQTLKADEVLILVDGPISDDLKDVIENSRYRVQYFEQNRGLPHVLNDGIKLAQNEIILRMDADDIAVPDRFEKQIAYLEYYQDVVVLGGQVQEFLNSMKNLKGIRAVPINKEEIKKFARWRNPFNHPTVAFKKSIIESIGGYNTEAISFEDYDLWLRVISKGYNVANLPGVLCYMRVNDAFIKRRAGFDYLLREFYLLKKMLSYNLIDLPYFILLCFVRLPLRLLPVSLLKVLYRAVLRKS